MTFFLKLPNHDDIYWRTESSFWDPMFVVAENDKDLSVKFRGVINSPKMTLGSSDRAPLTQREVAESHLHGRVRRLSYRILPSRVIVWNRIRWNCKKHDYYFILYHILGFLRWLSLSTCASCVRIVHLANLLAVVVLFIAQTTVEGLFSALNTHPNQTQLEEYLWIGTDSWAGREGLKMMNPKVLARSINVMPKAYTNEEFTEYMIQWANGESEEHCWVPHNDPLFLQIEMWWEIYIFIVIRWRMMIYL